MSALSGKLLAVTINGTKYRCQTDGTLNIIANVSEDDPCKPDAAGVPGTAQWVQRTVDSRDWNMSFSAKAFSDSLAAHNSDVSALMIAGNLEVQVEFLTTPGQRTVATSGATAQDIVYAGSGIITNFSLKAPVSGAGTYDVEIAGNGPLTLTRVTIV